MCRARTARSNYQTRAKTEADSCDFSIFQKLPHAALPQFKDVEDMHEIRRVCKTTTINKNTASSISAFCDNPFGSLLILSRLRKLLGNDNNNNNNNNNKFFLYRTNSIELTEFLIFLLVAKQSSNIISSWRIQKCTTSARGSALF